MPANIQRASILLATLASAACGVASSDVVPPTPTGPGRALSVLADNGVWISADELRLEVHGRVIAPVDPVVDTNGASSVELTWFEYGNEQRLNFYFATDGATWNVSSFRHYDGEIDPSWLYYEQVGGYFRRPMNVPFEGDVAYAPTDADPDQPPARFVARGLFIDYSPSE